jgi:hypothetical protein
MSIAMHHAPALETDGRRTSASVGKAVAWLAAGAALLAIVGLVGLAVSSPFMLLYASYYLTAGPEVTSAAAVGVALGLAAVVLGRRAAHRAVAAGAVAAGFWLVVIVAAMAVGASPPFHDRYAGRLSQDLAAARSFKRHAVAANVRALDRVGAVPGARTLQEDDNPEGERRYAGAYNRYGQSLDAEQYLVWRATGWGTFREYSLPPQTPPDEILAFYRVHMAGWRMRIREQASVGGLHVMDVAFWRGGRCVWLHLGISSPRYRPGRGYEAATDRSTSTGCLD